MSKSESRIQTNKIRRKQELRKNILLFIFTSCLILIFSFTMNSFIANAKTRNEDLEIKYYKSIIIQQGDSLWSIAAGNMNASYADTEAYIQEVKEMNGLQDDHITAGNYLIIPYFSSEFIE